MTKTRVAGLALLLVFAACCAIQNPGHVRDLLAVTFVWFAAGAGLSVLARPGATVNPVTTPAPRSAWIVTGLLLATTVVAVLFSEARFNSLSEFSMAGLIPAFALVALALAAVWSQEDWRRVRAGAAAVIATLALAAIIETLSLRRRASGPFIDANALGALFNVGLIPIAAQLAATARNENTTVSGWFRYWPWAALAVIALGQAVTASRGADLALIAGFVALAAVTLVQRGAWTRLLGVVAVVIAAHTAVAALPFPLRGDGTLALLADPSSLRSETSAAARLDIWRSTLQAWEHERPLLGTGLGTYGLIYPQYRSERELQTTGERAHNDYLERLLEGGLALALALLAFSIGLPLLALVRALRRRIADDEARADAILRAGSAAACLCLGLHAFVNFILSGPALAFLFALYLGHALSSPPAAAARRGLRVALRIAGIGMVVIVPISLLLLALSNWLLTPAGREFQAAKPGAWVALANLGVSAQPSNGNFRQIIVETEMAAAQATPEPRKAVLFAAAGNEIRTWLDHNRRDTHALESLARLADEAPQAAGGVTAVDALSRALAWQPQSPGLRAVLSDALQRQNRNEEAYAVLHGGLTWVAIARLDHGLDRWLEAGAALAAKLGKTDDAAVWADLAEQRTLRREALRKAACLLTR